MTKNEAIVLIYGGLRGALGLSLALMVGFDPDFSMRLRELVVFNMAGVATLTLLINGTTSGALCSYLGLVQESAIKDKIFSNLMMNMIVESKEKIEDLKMDRYLNLSDWQLLYEHIGIKELEKKINIQTAKHMEKQKELHGFGMSYGDSNRGSYVGIKDKEALEECRFRFISVMRAAFWDKYSHSQICSSVRS